MKNALLNKDMGATAGCTLWLLFDTIPEDLSSMKHGVKGDAWFGSTQTSKHVGIRGYECILQVKQYHSLFPKRICWICIKGCTWWSPHNTGRNYQGWGTISWVTIIVIKQFFCSYLPRMVGHQSLAIPTKWSTMTATVTFVHIMLNALKSHPISLLALMSSIPTINWGKIHWSWRRNVPPKILGSSWQPHTLAFAWRFLTNCSFILFPVDYNYPFKFIGWEIRRLGEQGCALAP